mgnify:FL=1
MLFNYCKTQQQIYAIDYYIFGHTHMPVELKIDNQATYINVGDWITHNTYGLLKEGKLTLKKYCK